MLGLIKPLDADYHRQKPLHMSRVHHDLGRSSHHSSPSPDRNLVNMQQAMRPKGKIPNVAIVGAGISGLRCADVLIKSGARVTMYEARDRIGGRVHQVSSGGHLMDIGANWIHGTKRNPIADIAQRTKTITHDLEERQAVVDTTGNRLEDDLATELSEIVWGIIVEAFQYSDENSAEIDKSKSLMDYFRERVPKIEKDAKKQALILEEAHMWGAFVGDSIERQSLKYFFLEECIDGENAFLAGTYKKIVADIATTALTKADIHFNREVVFFEPRQKGPQSPPQITIHTSGGIQQSYDEVVITTPLGWLKRHKYDAFPSDSPLPPRLIKAIDNTYYGRLEKVYITFPSAFWHQSKISSASSTTSSSNSSPSSNSSLPCPSTYPSFTHFFTPEYVPHPTDQPWNQSLVNLAALPASTAHPTLLFYLYGPCGTHLINALSSISPSTSPDSPYHITLRSFFEPYYSRLPNYNPSHVPIAFLATNWQLDPHAGYGSYTNFQVGLESGDLDIEAMRSGEGMGEERGIWFAGEHTAPFIALGTTTGAYWSGEGIARRIVALYEDLQIAQEPENQREVQEKDSHDCSGEEATKKVICAEKMDAANASGMAL